MPEGLAVTVNGWAHLQLELLAGTGEQLRAAVADGTVHITGLAAGETLVDRDTGQLLARILSIPVQKLSYSVEDTDVRNK